MLKNGDAKKCSALSQKSAEIAERSAALREVIRSWPYFGTAIYLTRQEIAQSLTPGKRHRRSPLASLLLPANSVVAKKTYRLVHI